MSSCSAGARPSTYAQELLSTAQVAQIPLGAGAASLAMARKSQLTGRLLAILDAKRQRTPASSRVAAVLGVVGLFLVLPVAALAPAAARATAVEPDDRRIRGGGSGSDPSSDGR